MIILGLFLNNEIRTGANRRYLELMESLASKGNSVFVLMNSNLFYEPVSFSKISIPVHYRRKSFPPASYLIKKAVKKNILLIPANIDWIHIHGDMHLPAAILLKIKLTTKIFFASRCNDIYRAAIMGKYTIQPIRQRITTLLYGIINRIREKEVAKYASLITFQNAFDRDDFIERTAFPVSNTLIIPGNIGLPRCTDKWKNSNRSTTVSSLVYIGLLSTSKGLQYLLEACSSLKKRGAKHFTLSVLGKLENAKPVMKMVESLGIEDIVRFEGFVDPFPFLAKCDLMVYPTLYDAFPDAVLESLHAGCPVIATSVGGIPDLLKFPELLLEQADSAGLADRIEKCINDEFFYNRIRKLCAERAFEFHFDWAEKFNQIMMNYTK